jgi:uncharacterized delta-60 repeat protein
VLDCDPVSGPRRRLAWLSASTAVVAVALAPVSAAMAASGDSDTGFGSKGIALVPTGNGGRSSGDAAVFQAGKLVVAGAAAQDTGSGVIGRFAVTRLNADGGRDTTFGTSGETLTPPGTGESEAFALALAPANKLVAVGSAVDGAQTKVAVVRYLDSGVPDPSFGAGGVVLMSKGDGGNAVAQGVFVAPDNQVVVTGTALDGGVNKAFVSRLDAAGGVEAWGGLISAGAGTDTRANAIARLGDGSYVVAGQAADTTTKVFMARVADANGQPTAGWGTAGNGVTLRDAGDGGTAIANDVSVSGAQIVVAGSATDASRTKTLVARFVAATGAPDPAFGTGGATVSAIGAGGTSAANGVAALSDGRVVVGGNATDDTGGVTLSQFSVVRYAANGQLDTTFAPASAQPGSALVEAAGQPAYGNALAVADDGKYVVAGRVGDGDGETLSAARVCSTDAQGCTGTGAGGNQTPGGTPGGDTRPAFECGRVVKFGIIEAEGCLKEDNGRFEASGKLMVNGLVLQPEAKSTIVLDTKARRLYIDGPGRAAGQVSARLGSITIFENLPLDVRLPSLDVRKVGLPDLDLSKRGSVFGFPLTGSADAALVQSGIQVTVQVGLPSILGGVTGSVSLKADMKDGFRPDGLRITAREAMLGPLTVKDLLISYDDSDRLWQGQATATLLPFPYGAMGAVAIQDGSLKSLTAGIDGLNIAVGPGVFLQRISFGIGVDPFTIIGGVGFTAGPQYGGVAAVRVDGNFRLIFPGDPLARLEISTNVFCQTSKCSPGADQAGGDGLKVVDIPLAGFSFSADTDGQIAFEGHIGYDISIVSLQASVSGWLDGLKGFNVEGDGTVCVFAVACAGAESVISSEGLAACGYIVILGKRVAVGFGIHWPADISVMALVCDIGPYRAVHSRSLRDVSGPPTDAFAAQATPQTVTFAGHKDYGIVRLTGDTGPPNVVVSGPGGEQIATPPDPQQGARGGRFLIFKDTAHKQTLAVIADPGSTAWTITPQPGSAAITAVDQADPLPQPSVTARVTGHAYARKLHYTVKHIDGQSVRFAEVGGHVEHVLGVTAKTSGTIAFAPRDGRAGKRKIIAQVIQSGLPRRELTVATYTAPKRHQAGRPGRIVARRSGTTLKVTWGRSSSAVGFQARVKVGDGRKLLFVTTATARTATVPDFKRTDSAVISVKGVTKTMHPGPARSLTVKAPRTKTKKKTTTKKKH